MISPTASPRKGSASAPRPAVLPDRPHSRLAERREAIQVPSEFTRRSNAHQGQARPRHRVAKRDALISDSAELTHAELEQRLRLDGFNLLRQLYQDHLDLRAEREERRAVVRGADGGGLPEGGYLWVRRGADSRTTSAPLPASASRAHVAASASGVREMWFSSLRGRQGRDRSRCCLRCRAGRRVL